MNEFNDRQVAVLDALNTLKHALSVNQVATIGSRFNPDLANAILSAYTDLHDELAKDIGISLIDKYRMLGNK